jgi:lipopolysaccharide transport system ATP-binding protein
LLEVGTGFHPELTGRENIFLNGAILGMSKEEIRRRFDEIVDFAGVEKFLDTPVKRYSSGMRVRLGFSVAAHLEPEILIVDEVLAVGDLKFQKKCLGKMQQVGTEGRTVIFVSHNTGAIGKLCSKVLHMKDGHLASMGDAKEIIKEYTFSGAVHAEVIFKEWFGDRTGNGPMKFEKAAIVDKEGDNSDKVFAGEAFCVKMTLNGPLQKGCLVSISIRNSEDVIVAHVRSPDLYAPSVSESKNEFICLIRGLNVRNDTYFVTLYLEDGIGTLNERLGNCLRFDVHACRTTEFESQGLLQVDDCWRHGIGP